MSDEMTLAEALARLETAGRIRLCSVAGCGRKHQGVGFCAMHRQRLRTHGDPLHPSPLDPPGVRFWRSVRKSDGCWEWAGSKWPTGYGRFRRDGRSFMAHREAVRLASGVAVAADMTVDHLCGNVSCVNPAHLEVVTMRVNVLRSGNPTAINARKVRCKRGHDFDEANARGRRRCSTCQKANRKARYHRNKAALIAAAEGL